METPKRLTRYHMNDDNPVTMWDSWEAYGKPIVSLYDTMKEMSYLIPEDAVIVIEDYDADLQFLESISHVKDVSFKRASDRKVLGYKGHVKFKTITISDVANIPNIPETQLYTLTEKVKSNGNVIDFRGKNVRFGECSNGTLSQCELDVLLLSTNISKLYIDTFIFEMLAENHRDFLETTDSVICIRCLWSFDPSILDGLHINKLSLLDLGPAKLIEPIGEIDYCVKDIVECPKKFEKIRKDIISAISKNATKSSRCVA